MCIRDRAPTARQFVSCRCDHGAFARRLRSVHPPRKLTDGPYDLCEYDAEVPTKESLGGGRRMGEEGLFDHFPVDAVYGMHNMRSISAGAFHTRTAPYLTASGVGRWHSAAPAATGTARGHDGDVHDLIERRLGGVGALTSDAFGRSTATFVQSSSADRCF